MKRDAPLVFRAGFLVSILGLLLPSSGSCYGQDVLSIRVAPTDLSGNPITTIAPDSSFLLNLYTADIRPTPRGVFSVYADVLYDPNFFAATSISYSDEYSQVKRGDWTSPGIIDEAGAVWDFFSRFPVEPGGGELRVLSMEMNSLQQRGTGAFSVNPADDLTNGAAVYGSNFEVPTSQIQFDGSQLTVTLACDADSDDDCDINDLNLLYGAFGTVSPLDLNGSGTVESDDIEEWLALASTPSNSAKLNPLHIYKNGDVNLDGTVNSQDLGEMLLYFGNTTGLRYADGNLNDDMVIDSSDLGILLLNFNHTSLVAMAVPEPRSQSVLFAVLLGWVCSRRSRRRKNG